MSLTAISWMEAAWTEVCISNERARRAIVFTRLRMWSKCQIVNSGLVPKKCLQISAAHSSLSPFANQSNQDFIMAHIVTTKCLGCKFTDCVEVCPVACFYELE